MLELFNRFFKQFKALNPEGDDYISFGEGKNENLSILVIVQRHNFVVVLYQDVEIF